MSVKIVEFSNSSIANMPLQLRTLAEKIERGEYGEYFEGVVVLNGHRHFSIFGFGPDAEGPRVHFLMACAQRKIENALLKAKE